MRGIKAIFIRNMINFTRDKMRFIFTIFMSVFFLFIFSFVMKASISGMDHPINYLISGIIIMTVFQTALNSSMSTIEDISSGFMKEILVSPVTRSQISIGQILSSTVISVCQGILIVIMGVFMGLNLDLIHLVEMLGVMVLVGATFSSMGLYLATLARNSGNYQILISVVVMPLTFLSGAYIPTTVMPAFLRPIVYLNPLTYTTAIFRFITLKMEGLTSAALVKAGVAYNVGGFTILPYMGLLIISIIGIAFFMLCVNKFNTADFSKVKVFKHQH
ncbi:MAG: ABC transporter permease [Bacillota bacterium]|nr:ABC transporter permease [Bacillota bacterium]